ncbi:MAG: hypothetical protein LBU38_03990 [Propionibacteriaceae bacterium]|nr:hypothetical protein [Propionibacteriaceae bacterium]
MKTANLPPTVRLTHRAGRHPAVVQKAGRLDHQGDRQIPKRAILQRVEPKPYPIADEFSAPKGTKPTQHT